MKRRSERKRERRREVVGKKRIKRRKEGIEVKIYESRKKIEQMAGDR